MNNQYRVNLTQKFTRAAYVLHTYLDILLSRLLPEKIRMLLSSIDRVQRYQVVAKELKKLSSILNKKLVVLDVGGGDGVCFRYLDHRDIDYTVMDSDQASLRGACLRGLKAICGDGCNIPCRDDSFDVVISIDTLEHVPPAKREVFLEELKRVSRYAVVIHCPFGETGEIVSWEIIRFIRIFGLRNKWLEDNAQYGLPRLEQLQRIFPNCRISEHFNALVCFILTIFQMFPVLALILPGLLYFSFLWIVDAIPPFVCCTLSWKKIN